jgi:hypothetical protein
MKNRRNYYRVLCVQPDAPLPVIRSSYAALMLKLKQHPDLGGDHETAALLNEAYAVLSHPAQRAEYDRSLQVRQSTASVSRGPFERAWPAAPDHVTPAPQAPTRSDQVHCCFCAAAHPGLPVPGDRCAHCGSPLLSPARVERSGGDKRVLPRFTHGGEIQLLAQRATSPRPATIQDLSPLGMCVLMREPLPVDQVVKVDGPLLSAVARVVSCRCPGGAGHGQATIGLEFLTLDFSEPRGTFVSRRT